MSSPTHPPPSPSSLTFIECGWCGRVFFSWTLKMLALTLSSACWCHVLSSHYTSHLKRCVQGGYNTIHLVCICVHRFVVWCVYDSCSLLYSYIHVCVVSYLVPWLFLLFWAQCAHVQLISFYHSDITHVRKATRPLLLFHTASSGKLGGAWEWGYTLSF